MRVLFEVRCEETCNINLDTPLTKEMMEAIKAVDGVETAYCQKYKAVITIGKLFDLNKVLSDVKKALPGFAEPQSGKENEGGCNESYEDKWVRLASEFRAKLMSYAKVRGRDKGSECETALLFMFLLNLEASVNESAMHLCMEWYTHHKVQDLVELLEKHAHYNNKNETHIQAFELLLSASFYKRG